jgi:hypothetical protein
VPGRGRWCHSIECARDSDEEASRRGILGPSPIACPAGHVPGGLPHVQTRVLMLTHQEYLHALQSGVERLEKVTEAALVEARAAVLSMTVRKAAKNEVSQRD